MLFSHFPPYSRRDEENSYEDPAFKFNVYDTLYSWMDQGAPKDKLVMGIPFYGRGFILEDPDWDGLYCPAIEGMAGVWGYQEILKAQNNNTLVNLPGAEPHQWKIEYERIIRRF